MTTQNNESHPFWSGFVVGSIVGTGLMYLIGTKKGRETAQKILENTENVENGLQDILNFLKESDILRSDENDKEENPINTIINKVSTIANGKKR